MSNVCNVRIQVWATQTPIAFFDKRENKRLRSHFLLFHNSSKMTSKIAFSDSMYIPIFQTNYEK